MSNGMSLVWRLSIRDWPHAFARRIKPSRPTIWRCKTSCALSRTRLARQLVAVIARYCKHGWRIATPTMKVKAGLLFASVWSVDYPPCSFALSDTWLFLLPLHRLPFGLDWRWG